VAVKLAGATWSAQIEEPTEPPNGKTEQPSGGLKPAEIAGIVVGCLAGVVLIVVVVVVLKK
jgi:hypothetical protein